MCFNSRIHYMQKPTSKARVIIYSRPGCHLCEEAKQAMEAAECSDEYTLAEINIESDPDLLRRYQNDIPVISIDGVEAFKHKLTSTAFRQRLLTQSGGRPTFPTSR
jgi:glutaredoxin